MVLLDTNVLVYALNEDAPQHLSSFQILAAAVGGRVPAVLVPQVLLECYSVATSARRVPTPIDPVELLAEFRTWREIIPVLEVTSQALDELERLVILSPRASARVYDLFLAAQMRAHGVREICTFNLSDFRLPGVRAYAPEKALARYRVS